MAILGDQISARDAERFGMVNRCVPHEELISTVTAMAAQVASGPTIRIGHIKSQINASFEQTRDQTFRDEANYFGLSGGDDATEAIKAYVERRPPRFTGR